MVYIIILILKRIRSVRITRGYSYYTYYWAFSLHLQQPLRSRNVHRTTRYDEFVYRDLRHACKSLTLDPFQTRIAQ